MGIGIVFCYDIGMVIYYCDFLLVGRWAGNECVFCEVVIGIDFDDSSVGLCI